MKRAKGPLFGKLLCLVLLISLCLFLPSKPGEQVVSEGQSQEEPHGTYEGWYSVGQSVTGGVDLTNMNLKDISIRSEAEETVVTLSFFEGSDSAGGETKINAVPVYSFQRLEGLSRYVLTLEGVTFWEYRLYPEEVRQSPVTALFRSGSDSEGKDLVFLTLSESCEFRTEEEGNTLRLRFKPIQEIQESHWFVTVDGYDLYPGNEAMETIHELSFYPTLCSDGNSILLVSRSFPSQKEAEEFLNQYEQTVSRILPGRVSSVTEILGCEAPEYDERTQITNLIHTPVGSLNGKTFEATVLQAGGRFQSWSPVSPSEYLYVHTVYEMTELGLISYEELWLHGETEEQILPGSEFTEILDAELSPDGRFVAVIDRDERLVRTLEVINQETQESFVLTEYGAGEDTPDFLWDESGTVLYCLSGSEGRMEFLAFDLSGEAPVASKLGDTAGESEIQRVKDSIVYIGSDPETEQKGLYRLPMSGGNPVRLADGNSAAADRTGRYCALIGTGENGERLSVYDNETGLSETVMEGGIIIDVLWDYSGKALYYTLYNTEAEDENQPLMLYRWTKEGGQELLMNLIPGTMYPAEEEGHLLLVYLFTKVNQSIAMTYDLEIP